MGRKSPDAMAAALYRSGTDVPQPPTDLRGAARTYWQQLVTTKPPDHWTGASLLLLDRLCRTAATATYVQRRFESNPASADAIRLIQVLVQLNTSCSNLAMKLRLTPQTVTSARATGQNAETGVPPDALLGGVAKRPRPLLQ